MCSSYQQCKCNSILISCCELISCLHSAYADLSTDLEIKLNQPTSWNT